MRLRVHQRRKLIRNHRVLHHRYADSTHAMIHRIRCLHIKNHIALTHIICLSLLILRATTTQPSPDRVL